MKLERYELKWVSDDGLQYQFYSTGPKGRILKVILFEESDDPHIYNLLFGNQLSDDDVDCYSIDNNGDRDKILATVAMVVYRFTTTYPDRQVYIKGSSPSRTRLYRMALTLFYEQLNIDFDIYGRASGKDNFSIEKFQKTKQYDAFIIRKK